MLRLEGERDENRHDVFPVRPVPEGAADAGDLEDAEPRRAVVSLRRGLTFAVAAFLPTFLAIFLGLQHLVGSLAPARVADEPSAVGSAPLRLDPDSPVVDQPDPETRSFAPPSLPPAPPAAAEPLQEPAGPRASAEPSPTTEEAIPAAAAPGPMEDPARWAPAAAFVDREAAARLASSVKAQGYPVEIRHEGSSSRPWVVWIREQPGRDDRR